MENGLWVKPFTQEKLLKAKELRIKWEEEIICPCIVFQADMDEVVICEKHLAEIMSKKDKFIGV